MAETRLQSGRVQAQGISSLPQPNMNFGQQRREVEYQAAAESSSVLSRTLSNISTQMFGTAQSMAESAGEEFVASNPITEVELKAMRDGNTEVFKREFSINAFKASVKKYRSQELSAYLELEMSNDAAEIQQAIELGKDQNGNAYVVDVNKIAEDWQAKTKGYGNSLAAIDPSAAYKFRAAAAVNGNRVLLAATKSASEQNFLKNQVKVDASVRLYTNIVRDTITSKSDTLDAGQLQTELDYQRETVIGNALVLGGVAAQKYAIEKTAQIEIDVKKAMFQNYIFSTGKGEVGDQVALEKKIRDNTLPPFLQKMWDGMSEPQRKVVRDSMAAEYQSLIKTKDEQKKLSDSALDLEVAGALDTVYDTSSSPERRTEAMVFLRSTSLTNPDKVSPKFLAIDLPKSLLEKVDDDPGGKADMIENFRNKKYTTVRDVLDDAIGLRVTPATAVALAKEYLPKDATEKTRLQNLADIEHDLRTKKIPKGNITELKKRLDLAGLTTADAPDFIRLLNEDIPVVDQKDDDKRYGELADLIERGEIPTVSALYQAKVAPNKGYITSESYRRLGDQLNRRNERLEAEGRTVGQNISGQSNSQNKTTKAEIAANATQDANDTYKSLLDEYNKTGSFTDYQGKKQNRPPTKIGDAGAIVDARFNEDKKRKNIDAQEKNIVTNYGSNSPYLSAAQKKLNPKFASLTPIFLNDKDMTADPVYIKSIIREMKRLDIETNNKEETTFTTTTGQLIGQNLINDQRALEQARRKLRGR